MTQGSLLSPVWRMEVRKSSHTWTEEIGRTLAVRLNGLKAGRDLEAASRVIRRGGGTIRILIYVKITKGRCEHIDVVPALI